MNNTQTIKVLSLFDGISCARVALERAGFKVGSYYSAEIDKYATEISKKNYPDIVRLGDVKGITADEQVFEQLQKNGIRPVFIHPNRTDLLIGGSPCQDLSIAKKDRKGLDGERSGLFWEYVRILNEVQPRFFILENVASMPKEAKDLISKTLGVEPVMINASLVSAQNRKRLFWVGKRNDRGGYEKVEIPLPEDRGILLKDIFDYKIDRKIKNTPRLRKTRSGVAWDTSGKNYGSQQDRAYSLNGKFPTIPKSQTLTKTNIVLENGDVVVLTVNELEKLQGLPKNYTDGILSINKRAESLGNAFNVDVVSHILKYLV